jgi:hypothetical protein
MKRNFKPGFRLDLGKKDVGLGACRNTCSWCPAKNNDL